MHRKRQDNFHRSHIIQLTLLSICIAAIVLFAGCTGGEQKGPSGPPPAPVSLVKAITADAPVIIPAVGNIKASDSVTIKAQVDGQLLRIHFLDGEKVTAGQPLFTIDPKSYSLSSKGALADLSKDRAAAEQARKDYERYKKLYSQGVVSRDEYEAKATAYKTARDSMLSLKASAALARRKESFTRITSPITGIAGSALLDEGNLVNASTDSLVVIKKIVPADLTFSVPEKFLGDIRKHDQEDVISVQAIPQGTNSTAENGLLTFIDNWVNPQTGMITLKARFPNLYRRLWPGQFVKVKLQLTTIKDAVLVPAVAVQQGPKGNFVFTVKDGKAVVTPVVIGQRVDDKTVISKGLKAGTEVVTEGMLRLFPGAPVFVPKAGGKS